MGFDFGILGALSFNVCFISLGDQRLRGYWTRWLAIRFWAPKQLTTDCQTEIIYGKMAKESTRLHPNCKKMRCEAETTLPSSLVAAHKEGRADFGKTDEPEVVISSRKWFAKKSGIRSGVTTNLHHCEKFSGFMKHHECRWYLLVEFTFSSKTNIADSLYYLFTRASESKRVQVNPSESK